MNTLHFPSSFRWGVATSAYQIEGATTVDSRGEAIWDRFVRQPGRIRGGATADVACEHYDRYREDFALLAELGLSNYRLSISWPRIFPNGRGASNPQGLDFYRRLIDELRRHQIDPMVTLYHWDLPQALEDQGGWRNRDTAYYFQDYASYLFRNLDGVAYWITQNEPWCAGFFGHILGRHAPGERDWASGLRVIHHLLLSHGLGVQAFRSTGISGEIGIALILIPHYSASDSSEDRAAAARAEGFQSDWFLGPLFEGRYPAAIVDELKPYLADYVNDPGDLAVIRSPMDFLGVNYYLRRVVRSAPGKVLGYEEVPSAGATTDGGWEIYPQGLTTVLRNLARRYPGVPLFVTENGAVFRDRPGLDGAIEDTRRISYLREHLRAVHAAIAGGADVRGFYVWTLLDDFEWASGYDDRFGLVYVDWPTQRRTIKASGRWYAEVVRKNALSDRESLGPVR